jgi:pepF/M3 family oligoendopeptidase
MAISDLGRLPHWDLSNVYPSLTSEQFTSAMVELRKQIDALQEFLDNYKISRTQSSSPNVTGAKVVIDGYIDRINQLLRLFGTLNAYVASYVTTDSFNANAKRLESELEIISVKLQEEDVHFEGWIGTVADLLTGIISLSGTAKTHSFYLRETADQSRFLMSDAEESLAAQLELSGGNAWSKLQGTICSQLSVDFKLEGKTQRMPIAALINLSHHHNQTVRQRAYEAELTAWDTVREPLAAALNGVKGSVITLYKKRGRTDALHASLDNSRIDREILETMLKVMNESFPIFRKYLKSKAKRLNDVALPWWDLFAPIDGTTKRYTWPETTEFITSHFSTFSERLAGLAKRAFQSNWIDAELRRGKRGGGFCMDIPLVNESRILCNFDGSLDQVSTVAHELGHAFHTECQVGKTMLQTRTPMTLAETASIFCETIITEAMLTAATPKEELVILETNLISTTQVIVDITSRFLFEKEVFERREKSELSPDDFCEIMLNSQKSTYGEGLDEQHLHKYMWTWKPHYYSTGFSFYNYPYAFGLLFGTGLYALYKERGKSFVPDFEKLLAETGEATPAELAARFNIDVRKPDFWRNSLKVIEKRIERYVEL